MKILITGGTGLIGTAMQESLQKKGHQITIVSRNPLQTIPGVSFISWDLDPLTKRIGGYGCSREFGRRKLGRIQSLHHTLDKKSQRRNHQQPH